MKRNVMIFMSGVFSLLSASTYADILICKTAPPIQNQIPFNACPGTTYVAQPGPFDFLLYCSSGVKADQTCDQPFWQQTFGIGNAFVQTTGGWQRYLDALKAPATPPAPIPVPATPTTQLVETLGTWTLKKGTSNVVTGLASYELCKAAVVSRGTSTLTKYSCAVSNAITVQVKAVPLPAPIPPAPITGDASVSWVRPDKDTDAKTLTDLTGYRLYYGTSPTALTQAIDISDANTLAYTIKGLAAGTYYFAVTSISASQGEGARTNIASRTIP